MNGSIWPPIGAIIVILLLLGFCTETQAYCRTGTDGNIYTDQTAEDIFVDPNNPDPAKRDFRLKEGSCAIDMGATLPEVTHDFDGVTRPKGIAYDIGAHEFIPFRPATPEGLRIN